VSFPVEQFPANRDPVRISLAMFRNSDIDAKLRRDETVERLSDSTGSECALEPDPHF